MSRARGVDGAGVSMRARIVRTVVAVVAVALAIFTVPLAVTACVLVVHQASADLQRAAEGATLAVGSTNAAGDPIELPRSAAAAVAVYEPNGSRAAGSGPDRADAVTTAAMRGSRADGVVNGDVVVATPVIGNETVVAVVRASRPLVGVIAEAVVACAALLACAGVVLAIVVLIARRTARAMSAPVEDLSERARRLGEDPSGHDGSPYGIAELDEVRNALIASDCRLRDQLARERRLAANASHQLRTPLAGMRVMLEVALTQPEPELRRAADTAIRTVDALDTTIDEVLELTRGGTTTVARESASTILRDAAARWSPRFADAGRRLRLEIEQDAMPQTAPRTMVNHVLDVLLENALVHGAGVVLLRSRMSAGVLAVDVADEGHLEHTGDIFLDGVSTDGSGVGLGFARRAAEDAGARILLDAGREGTTFTLLVPSQGAEPEDDRISDAR